MATSTAVKRTKKKLASPACGPGGAWSKAAPKRIRDIYEGDAHPQGWTLWRKHLAKRSAPSVKKSLGGSTSPLLWAVSQPADREAVQRILKLLKKPGSGLERAVHSWLSALDVAPAETGLALAAIAWATELPRLAEHLPERDWWQLCDRLIRLATNASRADDPLAVQLLHAELPVVLLYVLPELSQCQALAEVARRTLQKTVIDPMDQGALIHGQRLDGLRPLLACWTRTRQLSQVQRDAIWTRESRDQFDLLVELAVRWSRADGRQVLAEATPEPLNRRLLKTAIRLADQAKVRRLAQRLAEPKTAPADDRLPVPSLQLEAAGLAILRSGWGRRDAQLAVNHSTATMQLELSLGKQILWSGDCQHELRIDGQQLDGHQPWDQICWESDHEIDYLELELDLPGGVRIQRHIALAREDGFLFLADSILGVQPGKIEYRVSLPLAAGVAFTPEKETREGTLAAGKLQLRVLPLELNEWRSGPNSGSLQTADGRLELAQSAERCCLLAPLFVDLNPRRTKRDVTWRQLTVGRERTVVSRDEAVGYRVQVGREQWLFYRAFGAAATRTVLGRNLYNELLIGRFQAESGAVKTLVEIEA